MLYLQEDQLTHLKKCVFYIIYELKLPLRFSFKTITVYRGHIENRDMTRMHIRHAGQSLLSNIHLMHTLFSSNKF